MTESVSAVASGSRSGKRKSSSRISESEASEREVEPRAKRNQRSSLGSTGAALSERFWELEQQMCRELASLSFSPPVTHIYNPLEYAREPHQCYLNSYCSSSKRVMLFGMNPGPFGMAQTGVHMCISLPAYFLPFVMWICILRRVLCIALL